MSPLTRSYFWSWALYDLAAGVERETVGRITLAVEAERLDDARLGNERLNELAPRALAS
jgi:hypothetical protein